MSIALQTKVWRADLDSTAKLVLLRLADFADDDGGRVFASVPRIAADCGLGERTVQTAMRRLQAAGLLVMVAEADAKARRPRRYRIDVAAVTAAARPSREEEGVQEVRPTGAGDAPLPVQEMHPPGAGAAPLTTRTITPVLATGAGSASEVMALGKRIAAVTGWDQDPRWAGNFARLFAWLGKGWDAEADVLPTIARLTADRSRRGQGPPRGLEYFETAIADAFAARTRPVAEGTPQHDPHRRDPARPRYGQQQPANRFAAILQRQLVGHA